MAAKMACCTTAAQKQLEEELKKAEAELQEELKQIEEKDAQIANVQQCLREQLQGAEAMTDPAQAVREFRAELEAQRRQHRRELQEQRELFAREHRSELESVAQERRVALEAATGESSPRHQGAKARRAAADRAHQAVLDRLREAAQAEASKHLLEAEKCERELALLQEKLRPARADFQEVAETLRDARCLLKAQAMQNGRTSKEAAERLSQVQEEHSRVERRYADLSEHLRAQMRDLQSELRARTEELWSRNGGLQQRDQELLDVNTQLASLQSIFDTVSGQLHGETRRIRRLQASVTDAVQQKQEAEQLERMLEESHKMLTQMRDTLEKERADRVRTTVLLGQEQKRTHMLLEVLKQCKDKLEGLHPQASEWLRSTAFHCPRKVGKGLPLSPERITIGLQPDFPGCKEPYSRVRTVQFSPEGAPGLRHSSSFATTASFLSPPRAARVSCS